MDEEDDHQVPDALTKVAERLALQPTPDFISRCVLFLETASIRHTVLVLGPPAVGKSALTSVAAGANELLDRGSTRVKVVNPKALTLDQMFGYVSKGKKGVVSLKARLKPCVYVVNAHEAHPAQRRNVRVT